jgi:hypothetical protein
MVDVLFGHVVWSLTGVLGRMVVVLMIDEMIVATKMAKSDNTDRANAFPHGFNLGESV